VRILRSANWILEEIEMPLTVNAQVTDGITQNNVKVLGESPAQALGVALQALSQTTGLAMANATSTQGGTQQVAATATSSICAMIVKLGAQS
jgi:hypothetical protein